jgi:catechol 2,3-dioxygenase-like lactoylglutathione lyase family enzyme
MIKVTDVQYARIGVADLIQAEAFLSDLGLVLSARTDDRLYFRGSDADHHCYIAELGKPGYIGMALEAASPEDLVKISKADGASPVEDIDEPGGGKRVHLIDPAGFDVEIVFGIEKLAPTPIRNAGPENSGSERKRLGERVTFDAGPGQIKRLGHVVLFVENFAACAEFYSSLFGFIASDEMFDDADGETIVSSFLRCDKGAEHVDHHTLYLKAMQETRCHHLGLEVENLEAVHRANYFMSTTDYKHNWGVGRHVVGSNIFDQWNDPWGLMHEYFADMDMLNVETPTALTPVSESLVTHWGPPHPYL